MGNTQFGKKAFNNPTPSWVVTFILISYTISGVFMGWIHTATIMGPHTKDWVTQLVSLYMIITGALAPFFGVNIGSKGYVRAENVVAMDTPKKDAPKATTDE